MSPWEIVEEQISAIYTACLDMDFLYVNTPYSYESGHQTIKYPQETLSDKNGNCIDLTVMFASAFERLGMHPRIVLDFINSHAFVGCHIWKDTEECIYLEGTALGSSQTAIEAIRKGQEKFLELKELDHPIYPIIVDVHKKRKEGVYPVPF